MTKHTATDSDAGDRLARSKKLGELDKNPVYEFRKVLERRQDAPALKSVDFRKSYIEGRLRIILRYHANPGTETEQRSACAVWHCEVDALKDVADGSPHIIDKGRFAGRHYGNIADQQVMLVSDVELMDSIEFAPSVLEGLYLIKDESDDFIAGRTSFHFVTMKGRFCGCPVPVKREERVPLDGALVSLYEATVSVVQGTPQIVDSVADDCWGVKGEMAANTALFPSVAIGISAQGFCVRSQVGTENFFKLTDVMIGPFDL